MPPTGSRSSDVLILMPAWNESESLPETVAEVRAAVPSADVLVVDDGSTDLTAAVARACGVDVLVLPFNLGVGGAVRAGYRHAVRKGYRAVVQVDADGQHDPKDITRLLEGLRAANVVIGARFANDGTYATSWVRRAAMVFLARSISVIAGSRLTDTTSGFKAVDDRALAFFARNFPSEYLGDTVESLVLGARAGLRVQQVGVQMRQRRGGRPSHHPWKAAVYLARAVMALGMALVRRQPPASEVMSA